MSDVFRSRGIRILKDDEKGFTEQMKIYYEPAGSFTENRKIQTWLKNGTLSLFEYSMLEEHRIDTYNFHVNLIRGDYQEIYNGLLPELRMELDVMPALLDESFRNYTVGYRIEKGKVIGQSFYFYPTVLKEHRFGIKGVVDKAKIREQTDRLAKYISKSDDAARKEIADFAENIYKFKGVSVHIAGDDIGYKIYGRVEQCRLEHFLSEKMGYSLKRSSKYGEVVLTAQRIQTGKVTGYNIYYLT